MKTSPFFLTLTSMFLIMGVGVGWILRHKDLAFGGTLTAIGIVFLILTVISFIRERRKSSASEDRNR